MAGRPHEHEGTSLTLDHFDTNCITASSPRRADALHRSRESRRNAFSSVGLIGVALAVLCAGGAMFSAAGGAPAPVVDPAANTVRAVGGAPAYGPATGMQLNASLVDIAATPTGRGYWTTASDGGVFSFGDADFLGSVAGFSLVEPVVGIAATPSGKGYWLVASDGGVFAFGDAEFHGTLAGTDASSNDIVAISGTPSGNGYWLVGADGGVFAFGDAAFEGAATTFGSRAPIVAMAPTASGFGYFLLGADGGVFAFGDAHFAGSTIDGSRLATAIAIPSNGKGYQVARSDGSVAGRGGAASYAAPVGDLLVNQHPIVAIAARPQGGAWLATSFSPPAATATATGSLGDDPFLKCTRAHESDSAGGYRAVSPDGVYRGAYQFLRSTWNSTAGAAGRHDLVGVDPASASPADQDELAMFLYRRAGPGPWGGRCRGLS